MLAVSALRLAGSRPRLDRRRAATAALALGLALAVLLGGQLLAGGAPRVLTADEARAFPEFGPHGTLRFFASSTLDYLRQNRSGFDLRAAGSVLAVAAAALLLVRPATVRRLRAEVLALPVVALSAYVVAQAVLFRLYLPHRYTYPLVAFFAIAVGVALRPAWAALRPRAPARTGALLLLPPAAAVVALYAFPLGPLRPLEDLTAPSALAVMAGAVGAAAVTAIALGRVPAALRVGLGAFLTGACILVAMLATTERWARGTVCPTGAATHYLATLPKDAVVAGDPIDLKCLPGDGAAGRRDLHAARTRLRGGRLRRGTRADVRDAARLLRPLPHRARDAAHALRRDPSLGAARGDPQGAAAGGSALAAAGAPVRPVRPVAARLRCARRAAPARALPALEPGRRRGLRPRCVPSG